MYLDFFKLREFPFRLTPDTEFLYMSNGHARAKAYMDYTVWNREGFVVITGDIGCGKTTLIKKLLSELDKSVLVAKIFQTQLNEEEFLQSVLVEFGLNPFRAKKVELIDMLNTFLIERFLQDKQLVLIVDDAHNLGVKVLEEIRMLSGLETQKEKILHVILVGQPQLNDMLATPELEQLMQRVRLRYQIKVLSESDTRDYILHRMRVAGGVREDIFAEETFAVITKYTGGVPRLINTLCDTCLVCAYADARDTVTIDVLNAAIGELQWLPYAKRINRKRAGQTAGDDPGLIANVRENTRALVGVSDDLARLRGLLEALPAIATRLASIEAALLEVVRAVPRELRDTEIVKKRKV